MLIVITLTEFGRSFTHRIVDAVEALPGAEEAEVVPHWSPVWTMERLNPKARRALAESKGAMFRRIKRRSLESIKSGRCRRSAAHPKRRGQRGGGSEDCYRHDEGVRGGRTLSTLRAPP